MRDRVHVYFSKDDLTERATVDDLLQNAHRLVIAHILVDRDDLTGGGGLVAQGSGLAKRQSQRLLRQNGLDVLLLQRVADERGLEIRRIGDVDNFDRRILDQFFRCRVNSRNSPALGDRLGLGRGTRGDCPDRKTRVLIGRQMALGHDHAGANAADPEIPGSHRHIGLKGQWACHWSSPPVVERPASRLWPSDGS